MSILGIKVKFVYIYICYLSNYSSIFRKYLIKLEYILPFLRYCSSIFLEYSVFIIYMSLAIFECWYYFLIQYFKADLEFTDF